MPSPFSRRLDFGDGHYLDVTLEEWDGAPAIAIRKGFDRRSRYDEMPDIIFGLDDAARLMSIMQEALTAGNYGRETTGA